MNLLGIVSISGKPGLYKVIGQNKSGYVVESLDEVKTKLVTGANARMASLNDITVFGVYDDLRLKDIFKKMDASLAEYPIPDPKGDADKLKAYFYQVVSDYDEDRVYVSDMKKIISWYQILSALPLWNEADPEEEAEKAAEAPVEAPVEEPVAEAKPKKATKKAKK